MTAKRLSHKSNIVTARYIGYKLKHSWTVMLICFITLFFIINVSFMLSSKDLMLAQKKDILSGTSTFVYKTENFFTGDTVALILVGCCLAVVVGCHSLSYMNNKVSAGFFHSLPEKRSGHFIASLVTATADFIIPFVANILILTIITAAKGLLYKFVGVLILKMLFIVIFSYLSILAVCYVAGMLTGTTAIHGIFTLYLIFILPALEFFYLNWIKTDFLSVEAWNILLNNGIILSPAFRIFGVCNLLFSESSTYAVASLVIELIMIPAELILAFVLYKKRRIESSGTPIIYRKLSDIVKYSAIILMSLIGALFFRSIGNGMSWLIFGFCSGAVITFMIMNTVLNRTSKLMFKGLKGLGVCVALAAVSIAVAQTGFFGTLDYIVPTSEKIYITIGGNEYNLTDEDKIEEFRDIMKKFNAALKNDRDSVIFDRNNSNNSRLDVVIDQETGSYEVYEKEEWEFSYSVRCQNFSVSYMDRFDKTTTYIYNKVYVNALADIIKCLTESSVSNVPNKEDIGNIYAYINLVVPKNALLEIVESNVKLTEEMAFIGGSFTVSEAEYCVVNIEFSFEADFLPKEYQDTIREQSVNLCKFAQENSFNPENKQSIGNIYVSNDRYDSKNHFSVKAPIYLDDMKKLDDMLVEIDMFNKISVHLEIGDQSANFDESKLAYYLFDCYSDDYISQMSQDVDCILLYDSTTGKIQRIIGNDKIEELMNDAAQVCAEGLLSPFTQTDNRYVLRIVTNEEYNDGFITYLLKK